MSAVTLGDATWAGSATLWCRSRGVDQVFESHLVADRSGVPNSIQDSEQLLLGDVFVLTEIVVEDRCDQALDHHCKHRESPSSRVLWRSARPIEGERRIVRPRAAGVFD